MEAFTCMCTALTNDGRTVRRVPSCYLNKYYIEELDEYFTSTSSVTLDAYNQHLQWVNDYVTSDGLTIHRLITVIQIHSTHFPLTEINGNTKSKKQVKHFCLITETFTKPTKNGTTHGYTEIAKRRWIQTHNVAASYENL